MWRITVNRDNDAGSSLPAREAERPWRYRRHLLILLFITSNELLSHACRERCRSAFWGWEALGLSDSGEPETRFPFLAPFDVFHQPQGSRLFLGPGGVVGKAFLLCCSTKAPPATCKVISAPNLGQKESLQSTFCLGPFQISTDFFRFASLLLFGSWVSSLVANFALVVDSVPRAIPPGFGSLGSRVPF